MRQQKQHNKNCWSAGVGITEVKKVMDEKIKSNLFYLSLGFDFYSEKGFENLP